MSNSHSLLLKNLGFSFQYLPLFEDFSLEVKSGDVIHISGPNGAGKSTMMSIIAGLRSQTHGKISGVDRNGTSRDDIRELVEFLPADANSLYLKMDAMTNLRFWMKLRGLDLPEEKIISALEHWGLGHKLVRENFSVEKFSTGMRRRLALTRMTLSNAPCMLLDEPLFGLDTHGVKLFQDMLSQHKKQGGSALVISHDTVPLEGIITETIKLGRKK